ncbi:MAG: DUF2306 domain-containing protein [Aquabacterium sp.]
MSLSARAPLSSSLSWRTLVLRAVAGLLALAMLLYGVAAIDAGFVNFKSAGSADIAARRVAHQQAAEAGQPGDTPADVAGHSSVYIALLGMVSPPTYAYGERGLSEPLIHYATMPKANGVTLSLHNALGGTCMLFGALQFWPAFRRRFPRWHRAFGLVYLLAAQSAMIAAMVYLVRTPVALIYDQLTFYIGLWSLAIGVTFSLWMAVYSMWRKQIAQHQAWMSLNYGMLLTAPIQRYGWLAFGAFGPPLRQLEANYAVTGVLVPLCVMFGYGLFSLNRWFQADRSSAARQKMAQAFTSHERAGRLLARVGLIVLLAAAVSTVRHLMLAPGLSVLPHAAEWIPAGAMHMEDAVIAGQALPRWVLALATLAGLASGAHLLWTAFARAPSVSSPVSPSGWHAERFMGVGTWVMALSGLLVGIVMLRWGVQMGAPSFATLAGGSLYLFGGFITVVFSVLLAVALHRGQAAWVKEWGVFVLACLVATPSFYWHLPLLGHAGFDAQYVQAGHVFRMAGVGQWLPLIGAFVYAVYSEATHSKLAR